MDKLTLDEAKRINDTMVTEEHLKLHAANVAEIRIEGMKAHAEELHLTPETLHQ